MDNSNNGIPQQILLRKPFLNWKNSVSGDLNGSSRNMTNPTILIVDDSEELRQALYDQFIQEDFLVDLAEDGDVA